MEDRKLSLQEQFMRIHWLVHRHNLQNHHAHGPMGNPYQGQGRVLRLLQMRPEISQKDLSYLLDMRPQSLGKLLSKLERSGYVARTLSETDRRVMNIRLTEEGMKAADRMEEQRDPDAMFSCLSEEEQSTLSEFLDRIIADMEAQCEDEQEDFGPGRPGWPDRPDRPGMPGRMDGRGPGPGDWHHDDHHHPHGRGRK